MQIQVQSAEVCAAKGLIGRVREAVCWQEGFSLVRDLPHCFDLWLHSVAVVEGFFCHTSLFRCRRDELPQLLVLRFQLHEHSHAFLDEGWHIADQGDSLGACRDNLTVHHARERGSLRTQRGAVTLEHALRPDIDLVGLENAHRGEHGLDFVGVEGPRGQGCAAELGQATPRSLFCPLVRTAVAAEEDVPIVLAHLCHGTAQ
mmetsp:Transcript_85207/g.198104  ORF Transcript_85207/g.198104 Transcript_85207/m.198104 type:complete len:202 (+) Transcript_85207:322-927(+)